MPLLRLLALTTSMVLGTFLVGSIPLVVSLPANKLVYTSVYGGGLILGASLMIVLPEGIAALYSAQAENDHHEKFSHSSVTRQIGVPLVLGFITMILVDRLGSIHRHDPSSTSTSSSSSSSSPDPSTESRPPTSYILHRHFVAQPSKIDHDSDQGSNNNNNNNSNNNSNVRCDSDDELDDTEIDTSRGFNGTPSPAPSTNSRSQLIPEPIKAPQHQPKTTSTALGLLIHSLADGMALGASIAFASTGDHDDHNDDHQDDASSLDIIVFIAIMAHKAPAAIGLVSVLLGDGLSRTSARKVLLLFSLAAPLGAIVTYSLIYLINDTDKSNAGSLQHWTAIALIFSGGTMLYVATHVLNHSADDSSVSVKPQQHQTPSLSSSSTLPVHNAPSRAPSPAPCTKSHDSSRLAFLILGIITPGFLQYFTEHSHVH